MQDRIKPTSKASWKECVLTADELALESCVSAAEGYLELGMPVDSWSELEAVPASYKGEEAVLDLRIRVFEHCKRWDFARQFAEALTKHFPANTRWWLAWSRNLRQEKSVESARDVLEEAMDLHPSDPLIQYQLACLVCAMGETEKSVKLLKSAFSLDADLMAAANDEPDLKRLGGIPNAAGLHARR